MKKRIISFASTNSSVTEEGVDAEMQISIDSIENIIRNEPIVMQFTIEQRDVILGESGYINIDSSYKNISDIHPINFQIPLPYTPNKTKFISLLVESPLLIKVYEIPKADILNKLKKTEKSNDDCNSRESIKNNEERSISDSEINREIFGMCNVDLLPIILGETTVRERIFVETPSYTWDNNIVSWENLAKITVTIQQDETNIVMSDMDFNFLHFTVESLYNLPGYFSNDLNYKCGTVFYLDNNIGDSIVIFDGGKWTDLRDVENLKSWCCLQDIESRARLSKYKISPDFSYVKNDFKEFDLKKTTEQNANRIKWNSVHRGFLNHKHISILKERLKQYKYWPFELLISENDFDGESISTKSSSDSIYQFYVDISQLIFPGQKKARVLSQLYTYNPVVMKEKTGLELNIFSEFFDNSESEGEERQYLPCVPLFNENGEPVLILVEFELYQPFYPSRILEEYFDVIALLKKEPKPTKPIYCYTPDLVHEQYIDCIKQLTDILTECYRDFIELCECKSNSSSESNLCSKPKCEYRKKYFCNSSNTHSVPPETTCPYFYLQDDLDRFKQYLHETGKYVSIRSTLKNKIINLLDQKFVINSSDWCSVENQDFIVSCYTYLVQEMHIALNTKIDVRLQDVKGDSETPTALWYRAEEAYEWENYEKADKILTKIIYNDRYNPDRWIYYGIFFLRNENIDEAIECTKEVIRLDNRHKIGLLMYGILLATKEKYTEAEIYLKSVTHFYPRFAEGWMVLHLLYLKIEYSPGIDITLELAKKCTKDKVPDDKTIDIFELEPIAWTTSLCDKNKIYLLTALLLLKLNLHHFAGLALTKELSLSSKKSVPFLYYFSVNAYLNKKYEIALDYLNQAEGIIGVEYSIAALLGHTYYKLGNFTSALKYYESVDRLYDRPENIHLVHIRIGFNLINKQEWKRARTIFSRACKESPSSQTWLGLGISNYHLENYDECEASLTEANRIDDEDGEVWAYLCLLSMQLHRDEEFSQCYRQVVKNNLKNDKLWRLLKHTMEILDFSSPIIIIDEPINKCNCLAQDEQ